MAVNIGPGRRIVRSTNRHLGHAMRVHGVSKVADLDAEVLGSALQSVAVSGMRKRKLAFKAAGRHDWRKRW